jgi:hypothetical protein
LFSSKYNILIIGINFLFKEEQSDSNKLLEDFRESWKQEIKSRQNDDDSSSSDKLETAKQFFLEGSRLESQGKVSYY